MNSNEKTKAILKRGKILRGDTYGSKVMDGWLILVGGSLFDEYRTKKAAMEDAKTYDLSLTRE